MLQAVNFPPQYPLRCPHYFPILLRCTEIERAIYLAHANDTTFLWLLMTFVLLQISGRAIFITLLNRSH